MSGNPEPIRWSEIMSFLQLHGLSFTPGELRLLIELDSAYLAELQELRA